MTEPQASPATLAGLLLDQAFDVREGIELPMSMGELRGYLTAIADAARADAPLAAQVAMLREAFDAHETLLAAYRAGRQTPTPAMERAIDTITTTKAVLAATAGASPASGQGDGLLTRVKEGGPGWHEKGPTCDGYERHVHLRTYPHILFAGNADSAKLADAGVTIEQREATEQAVNDWLRSPDAERRLIKALLEGGISGAYINNPAAAPYDAKYLLAALAATPEEAADHE